MVSVEGYWKVQLVCLIILLVLIAVVVAGLEANDGNLKTCETSNTIATCTDILVG